MTITLRKMLAVLIMIMMVGSGLAPLGAQDQTTVFPTEDEKVEGTADTTAATGADNTAGTQTTAGAADTATAAGTNTAADNAGQNGQGTDLITKITDFVQKFTEIFQTIMSVLQEIFKWLNIDTGANNEADTNTGNTGGNTTTGATGGTAGTLQKKITAEARKLIGSTNFRGPEVGGGNKACAQVVSTALKAAGAVPSVKLGVLSVLSDLRSAGWQEVRVPPFVEGDVITWKMRRLR